MKTLIFGSRALKHWFPDLEREPKDLDVISRNKVTTPSILASRVETHWTPAFQYVLRHNIDPIYVDADYLYTIKVSHAAWDIKWDKTMHDIMFMRNKGCKLDYDLFNLLYPEWAELHGRKHVQVKGPPEVFFNANVSRVMDHEKLHELVAFYDRPLHERTHPKQNDVTFSTRMFFEMSKDDQIKCAQEEAFAFALERFSDCPPKHALYRALKHLITKSTKGVFNIFLIENFSELLYSNRDHYFRCYNQYKEIVDGKSKIS